MKFLRILAIAAFVAYGAIIGGASPTQAAPMTGLLLGAPAVRTLEKLDTEAFPVEKTYYYYRRHYWHRHYWHRRYYHPYWHRRYYHPYWHRRYYHRYYW